MGGVAGQAKSPYFKEKNLGQRRRWSNREESKRGRWGKGEELGREEGWVVWLRRNPHQGGLRNTVSL